MVISFNFIVLNQFLYIYFVWINSTLKSFPQSFVILSHISEDVCNIFSCFSLTKNDMFYFLKTFQGSNWLFAIRNL